VKVDEDSLELAESLIKKRSGKFDPGKFTDGYEVALKELVEAKIKHMPIPQDEAPAPKRAQVINLMDALRKSVQSQDAPAPAATSTAKKKPSGRQTPTLFPEHEEKGGISLVKSSAKSASRASASAKTAKGSAKRKSA
jgi:DNA end-binding protein Ku